MPPQARTYVPGQSAPPREYGQSQVDTRGVFGQVMGLVAITVAFTALGAYIARDFTGGAGFFFFIGAFACLFGIQAATRRGREQVAVGLLFAVGLLLGMFVGPVLAYYAKTDPAVLWQAAGATALFTSALGGFGYATKRDLSSWLRVVFIGWVVLMIFGLVWLFVAIPNGNIIWAVLGLVVFGGFTIIDFNRLRRTNLASAPLMAASIFLDVFNVFLFFLSLFGGSGRR